MAVMFSCNGIIVNYAIVMYDKTRSKVKIVQDIARELPVPSVISYFLCDSWYTCGLRQKVSEFALHLRKTDTAVSLVTVGSRSYYVYCYEGNLNELRMRLY